MSQKQPSLVYSSVARGTAVLAEHSELTAGNFAAVAAQCIEGLPSATTTNKFTYRRDGYSFNFLVDSGYAYCVVAAESAGVQIPVAFLERVKEDFNRRYGGGKAATATARSLNREFGPKLKGHMKYCMDHPEEISRTAKVQAQISEVKEVMLKNIDKVIERQEKLEVLVEKTEDLQAQAHTFKQRGTQLRRKFWVQNMKTKLIVLSIIIILILIIVLSICKGFNC